LEENESSKAGDCVLERSDFVNHLQRATITLITNNPACFAEWSMTYDCLFNEAWDYGQVLVQAYEKIGEGYQLLTHPLAGSMKPNQTPYRSILLSRRPLYGCGDFDSLSIIHTALETYEKFQRQRQTPAWSPGIKPLTYP